MTNIPLPATATDADILEGYRIAAQIKPVKMAKFLNISRQRLSNYLNGINKPETDILTKWFLHGKTDWVREMALDMLTRRPLLDRPCVCLEYIGDNGPCPRHAATLAEEVKMHQDHQREEFFTGSNTE